MAVHNTHDGPKRIAEYMKDMKPVFFIGVGGVMMSSLALLTEKAKYPTYGSDRYRTPLTEQLRADNITIFYEHDASNLPDDCGLVVYTVAISPDNPEYVAARERGIPCVSRSDFLGYLMTRYRRRVGVAGMHGKSTCTSICAQIFMDADVNPTILSGAAYGPMGGAYRLGGDDHFIFEACEYMDSFLDFQPTVAILLGAELEHVDYFKDMEHIRTSFAKFASLTGPKGTTIVNLDDPEVMESATRALKSKGTGHMVTFSIDDVKADFHAKDVEINAGYPSFTLVAYGKTWGKVQLAVPGRFQIYNCLAAAAAADTCGIDKASIIKGLGNFRGADRRMQPRGKANGAMVYDDYGHHPTEVKATLEGAAHLCTPHADGTPGRLLCAFQPHTYSRTAQLYDQFLTAFDAADRLCLIDIYAARETDTCGVSSRMLAASIGSRAIYCADPTVAAKQLLSEAQAGDVIVVMGAGDVLRVTDNLLTMNL